MKHLLLLTLIIVGAGCREKKSQNNRVILHQLDSLEMVKAGATLMDSVWTWGHGNDLSIYFSDSSGNEISVEQSGSGTSVVEINGKKWVNGKQVK